MIAVVAAAALIACGRQTDQAPVDPSAVPTVDVCPFFTAEDAAAALGEAVDPTAVITNVEPSSTINYFLSCNYHTQDGGHYANVSLRTALTPEGAQDSRDQFARQKPANATDLPGVGDEAYWDPGNGQIVVLVGDNLVLVSLGAGGADISSRSLPQTRALAEIAIPHLNLD